MKPRERFAINLRKARQKKGSRKRSWASAATCTAPRSRCSSAAAASRGWARSSSSPARSTRRRNSSARASPGCPARARLPDQEVATPSWVQRFVVMERKRRCTGVLGQELFEQALGGAEEALQRCRAGCGVVDQFDRLVERDALHRFAQGHGKERVEGAGVFGVVDGAQQAGPNRPGQLRVARSRSAR